jgi:hypothetical protein
MIATSLSVSLIVLRDSPAETGRRRGGLTNEILSGCFRLSNTF